MMLKILGLAACVTCAAAVCGAQASVIPYGAIGAQNAQTYTFKAAGGAVTAYFAGSSAAYANLLGLEANGVDLGVLVLHNHTSTLGQSYTFGSFAAGTTLTFHLDTNGDGGNRYFSDAARNADGFNHLYSTAFTGGAGIPASVPFGIYLGFEDIKFGGDRDYNDATFVVTGVVSGVPEPATWAMMLIGLAGLGLASARRRKAAAA